MRIKSCFVCHKSFLLSIVLLLLSVMFGFTQLPPDTLWTKTFPGIYSDIARQVQPTIDGGFVIAGESESFGPGIWSVYVVKHTLPVRWNGIRLTEAPTTTFLMPSGKRQTAVTL